MASIKDLMDVDDIEPLEAQAHRRSRQAQQEALLQQQQQQEQQQLSQNQTSTQGQPEKSNSSVHTPPQINGPSAPSPSPSLPKRRKSDRASKHSGASHSRPSSSASGRRRSSAATTDSMDGMNYGLLQPADMRSPGIPSGSASGSMRQTSSGAEGSSQPQVRYTPVTGRVSRARKGQPVHVCDRCNPPRVFTRAEHLRRHALGHDKPRFQCNFSGCEKSFHRQDLLLRHKSRHEAGEIMDKEGGGRSRSYSDSDDSQTPPFKVKSPLEIDTSAASGSGSGSGSASAYASQPSGSTSGTLTGTTPGYQTMGTIFGGSNEGLGNRNGYGGPGTGNVMSQGAAISDFGSTPSISDRFANINQPLSSNSLATSNSLGMGNPGSSVSQFGYQNSTGTYFNNSLGSGLSSPPELLLEIPGEGSNGYHHHHDNGNQNLTYSSDFGSSDDTCSTTPSDASRFGSAYPRERQLSVSDASNSGTDWTNPIEWPSSHIVQRRLQTPRLGEGQFSPDGLGWGGRFSSPPWLSPNMQQQGFGRGTPSPVGPFQMSSPRRPYMNPPQDDNEDMSWAI